MEKKKSIIMNVNICIDLTDYILMLNSNVKHLY